LDLIELGAHAGDVAAKWCLPVPVSSKTGANKAMVDALKKVQLPTTKFRGNGSCAGGNVSSRGQRRKVSLRRSIPARHSATRRFHFRPHGCLRRRRRRCSSELARQRPMRLSICVQVSCCIELSQTRTKGERRWRPLMIHDTIHRLQSCLLIRLPMVTHRVPARH
jgi:hypothetical protein